MRLLRKFGQFLLCLLASAEIVFVLQVFEVRIMRSRIAPIVLAPGMFVAALFLRIFHPASMVGQGLGTVAYMFLLGDLVDVVLYALLIYGVWRYWLRDEGDAA